MTTSTERLHKLLDERGVEWREGVSSHTIEWMNANGQRCSAMYWNPTFSVCISECTPEQAIAATLGSGTCRLESMHSYTDSCATMRYVIELSCHTLDDWSESEPPAYCPWCGAKVVEQ